MSRAQDRWETHRDAGHNWALVLAAGEGSRLQALTMTASGVAVPKQFCSLGGGASLLHDALRRAQVVAAPERTCAVVAEHHRRWWQGLALNIPARNLIVQPRNRGTANGILLPLLHIIHWDPEANLLILPSDHYVSNEDLLALSLRRAAAELEHGGDHIILLGVTPEETDPELGYIVAQGDGGAEVRTVSEFVEKPTAATARMLIARGGIWNSFIFAVNARALLRGFEARCPDVVGEMRHVVTSPAEAAVRRARLAQVYEHLPELDFSRDILQRSPSSLRVLTVPWCGWSDLGTPRRVAETVNRYKPTPTLRCRQVREPFWTSPQARHNCTRSAEPRRGVMKGALPGLGVLVLMAACATTSLPERGAQELSGVELYERLCASCHGAAGHGDGPVASLIKIGVPDLTRIAQRDGSEFPAEDVRRTIDGRWDHRAHGARDMPVWGWQFYDSANPNDAEERARVDSMIGRLVDYLRSIQVE